MTFDPHPRLYFQPDKQHFRLTPIDLRLQLFERFGLDLAVVLPFDAALAGLTAQEFVTDVLVKGLGVSHVVTGYNFFFGKGRGGDPDVMRALGRKHGFGVTIVEAVGDEHNTFSSSQIRQMLAEGAPRDAAQMLGYWWRVSGHVTKGAKLGTGMGFPTANIVLDHTQELRHGIYAVRIHLEDVRYRGAAYLGTRPTFDDGPPVLEVFMFDFDGDIYGKAIDVEFIEYIRGDAKFDGPEDLKAQMDMDCEAVTKILSRIEEIDPMAKFPLGQIDSKSE